MQIIETADRGAVEELLRRTRVVDLALERRVKAIVSAVRREGDRALVRYARRFDGLERSPVVEPDELRAQARKAPLDVRRAIRVAARNIALVSRAQLPRTCRIQVAPGLSVIERVVPLERVGCYVPGGRYPLPSSLLMTAIPARVAGVPDIVAVCPRLDPVLAYAALAAGVTRFFLLGGAQAVAALAYGTETVPAVDKIVGPGNRYVSAAKALVSRDCAIDFHAGPSEVVIVSRRGRADWIAADMLAQAEHDVDARAILVTPNRRLAAAVERAIRRQLPASGPAAQALHAHGAIIVTRSLDEAVALADRLAPEHLACDDEAVARRVRRAGTIFVGPRTVPAAGDYATGSNHVLPTAGAARFRGGLTAADFVRVVSVQRASRTALAALAPSILALARAEGLECHARSVEARL